MQLFEALARQLQLRHPSVPIGILRSLFQSLCVLTLHFKSSEKCFSRFRVGLWQLMMPFCGWGWTKQQHCNVYEFMAKYAIQQHLFQAKAENTTKTNYDVGKCCNFQLWQHFPRILFHLPGQGCEVMEGVETLLIESLHDRLKMRHATLYT